MTEAGEKWLEDCILKAGANWDAEYCLRAFVSEVEKRTVQKILEDDMDASLNSPTRLAFLELTRELLGPQEASDDAK